MSSDTSITDGDIRAAIARDFGGHGGGRRLEAVLSVSSPTASLLRRGGGDLRKAAAWYGYLADPARPGHWLKSEKPLNPRFVGRIVWSKDVLASIEYELSHGRTTPQLASHFGISRAQLIRVMREHNVKKPSRPQRYPGCSMPAGFTAGLQS